ncbi:MAG: hypothetical protein GVY36_06145 [Verrucomicrobia bacterium]|jgi:hypothetical protein|nr:hypothetical protein [Verrucomicrobiota bacterium]
MKDSLKLNARRALAAAKWPRMVFYRGKYLFLLSHMRARSSLLSHILGSNQEICGYKEENRSYPNNRSLLFLRMRLMVNSEEYKLTNETNYFMDKIVHNKFEISPKILERENTRAILLVREPVGTYQSMIRLARLRKIDAYANIDIFADSYVQRLEKLVEYSVEMKKRALYVDSDSLLDNIGPTLKNISTNLNLSIPLSDQYQQFKDTGRPFSGDSSESIKRGCIFKPKYDTESHSVPEICHVAYETCVAEIENNSIKINA